MLILPGYVMREPKVLVSTEKGRPDAIQSANLTGPWARLDAIGGWYRVLRLTPFETPAG